VRILEYIEAHLGERLSLDVLAAKAAVSKFHFARVFRRSVEAPHHRHVQHLGLQAAAGMLGETDKSPTSRRAPASTERVEEPVRSPCRKVDHNLQVDSLLLKIELPVSQRLTPSNLYD
jgi:AraC-like DNA-binding protein